MASEHPWWGPARVPFLLLTPACMALGVAWSAWQLAQQGQSLNVLDALLCVLGALAAHVAVNALNEHHDFRSGLDQRTQRTPFSGGSGVLPANPALAPVALAMGWGALLVTVLTGLYFVVSRPTHLVGIYNWRHPLKGLTYLRFAFAGELRGWEAERRLDDGIVGARWLSLDEVRACRERHRSPLILRCIEDHLAGKCYPLDLLAHYG